MKGRRMDEKEEGGERRREEGGETKEREDKKIRGG